MLEDSRTLAHALPTSYIEDPDLALIVGMWDRLADECKRQMVDMVRANLAGQERDSWPK